MMTPGNADGGAVPPTTHYAIKPCCLICADVQFDKGFFCNNGMRGDELTICSDFKLRDFGYPVRTVEVVPMRPNATECKYYAYFDSIAALCKHDESPNGDCTAEDCPINGAK